MTVSPLLASVAATVPTATGLVPPFEPGVSANRYDDCPNTGAACTSSGVAEPSLLLAPLPTLFTARTWNVYAVPAVRPVTSWLSVSSVDEMSAQSP